MTAPTTNPLAPFEAWASNALASDTMSQTSIDKYRPLWLAWVQWLSGKKKTWSEATSKDIVTLLSGPAPGQAAQGRPAISTSVMSNYTRQRYWRLLDGIYTAAVSATMLDKNPVLDVPDQYRPHISPKDRRPQVLPPRVLEQLCQPQVIEAIFPMAHPNEWWHARDRAILAVLVSTALTSSELIAMCGAHVRFPSASLAQLRQTSLVEPQADGLWHIDVMASLENVERSLPVHLPLVPLLQTWAETRDRLLVERAAANVPLAQRNAFMAKYGHGGPFFMSRKQHPHQVGFSPMDPTSLYYTVSKAFKNLKHLERTANYAGDAYVPKGPAVVRNSVIAWWVDTLGPQQAAVNAGLAELRALRSTPLALAQ